MAAPTDLARDSLPVIVPRAPGQHWLLGKGGPARRAGSGRPSKQDMRQRRLLIGSPHSFQVMPTEPQDAVAWGLLSPPEDLPAASFQ